VFGAPWYYCGNGYFGDSEVPFGLAASAHITASGENTTAQLTAPSGKTTADFGGGRIDDDEVASDEVNLAADKYGEWEKCFKALPGAVDAAAYRFRAVHEDGTPLDTYTDDPRWTIAAAGGGGATSLVFRPRRRDTFRRTFAGTRRR
jgi:hypothetical protein